MAIGERVESRMVALGLSQAELARRVGMSQPSVWALLNRNKTGSRNLHRIARELRTTPAYLTGETDNPDEGAPPPPPEPRVQIVNLPVALPSRQALERAFAGVLALATEEGLTTQAELARELATQLPSVLAGARDALPVELDQADADLALPEARPNADPAPRRASRT
jgi:transcriptional regulator with XRE-family HTH domain